MRANDEERQIKALIAQLLRRKVELLIRLNDAGAEIAGAQKGCREKRPRNGRSQHQWLKRDVMTWDKENSWPRHFAVESPRSSLFPSSTTRNAVISSS